MLYFDGIKRVWEGGTAFIIGGGPSLKDFDFTQLKGKQVIGVNNAFMLGEDIVSVAWWGDAAWFDRNHTALRAFKNPRYHCCNRSSKFPNHEIQRVARGKSRGIASDPRLISWNQCSGSSAINLAYHLGAKRVVLLGFDMKFGENRENNWHNYHADTHKGYPKDWNPYDRFLECFPHIARDAYELGLEIINANPDSAIIQFQKITLEEALLC